MFTDPRRIKLSDQGHPDSCNVFSYYTTFIPEMKDEVCNWCLSAKKGCTDCKKILAENIIDKISPIQIKRAKLCKEIGEVKKIIAEGNNLAQSLAAKTMKEVFKSVNI